MNDIHNKIEKLINLPNGQLKIHKNMQNKTLHN